MTLKELQRASHEIAREHGWWDGMEKNALLVEAAVPIKLALIHSEISEALEEYRVRGTSHRTGSYEDENGNVIPRGLGIELADAVIRIADLAEWCGIDLEKCIAEKQEYNRTRSYRHGGKRA